MDYLEFIARTTSHIPDKGQVTVRYYGLYANAHRGKIRKSGLAAAPLLIMEEELLTMVVGDNKGENATAASGPKNQITIST